MFSRLNSEIRADPAGRRGRAVHAAVLAVACAVAASPLLASAPPHPYILWTKDDAAALRKKIEGEPWAKAAYEKMAAGQDPYAKPLARLFQCLVMGDPAAGEAEKKELLALLKSPDPLGGALEFQVLRYDILYDSLSADERQAVEGRFRRYIEYSLFGEGVFDKTLFNDSARYSRYDARKYTRSNWLPNIIWPRKVSANLMAVALADEPLVRRAWSHYGSWQWYFDEYLCDVGFYAEEFSKMGATPGAMLLYCLGAERLGLNDLGFGYRGKGGATLRGHIESLIHLGYPRVDLGTAWPHYPMVTMGDLRQSGSSQETQFGGEAFQHSLVRGYLADGTGGNERWKAHGAWGGTVRGNNPQWDGYANFTPKMQSPLWFEIGQKRWPDAGFDYFLAQMRAPGEDKYCPTLFFGLDPIDPAKVKPPPAPSAVWPERGLVMLRADESPAYWESEAPAVAMRLASDYAHNVNDAFALLGYYAFNRPIYLNRQVCRSYAFGWSRSAMSHCTVIVDGGEPKFTSATQVRHGFDPPVKFVAACSSQVWPGVDLTRALFLTREYLLDVARLASDQPHAYHWLVHTLGEAAPERPGDWQASTELAKTLYEPAGDRGKVAIRGERSLAAGDKTWSLAALQTCALPDVSKSRVGRAWYDKKIGVRMTMLGEAGTTAYVHQTPDQDPPPARKGEPPPGPSKATGLAGCPEPNEFGGVTIVAARRAPATAFVVLHEPFKGGTPRIAELRRIQQTQQGVAVAVEGKAGSGINDRVLLRWGDDADKPLTLSGQGESFTFADRAYVRVGKDRVEASGDLRAMKVRVAGTPQLILNGKKRPASVSGGVLTFVAAP